MPKTRKGFPVSALLTEHFGKQPLHQLVTSTRRFPTTARLDLHTSLKELLEKRFSLQKLVGVHQQWEHGTISFSHLMIENDNPVQVAPLRFEEIDLGNSLTAQVLKFGLWLCTADKVCFAVFLSPAERYGEDHGVHLELAVTPDEDGARFAELFLRELENGISETGSYRGKVISLEAESSFRGHSTGLKVHNLRTITRDEVILPAKTLDLLERNILRFVDQRERLRALRLPVKKGLLFYGPPGTGKTHTIHFLAGSLPGHTTLLITGPQVGLLGQYMQLARFLQPALVVIEDVDLIARDRRAMHGPCEESLLNRLLSEMDGLREDAEIFFVLTTNRPEELEPALASRPGRIDQAVEFPLPDDEGRRKLVRLYARDLLVSEPLCETIVRRTEGGSAALIKELMRRSAQFALEDHRESRLEPADIESALEEMLLSGGTLNARLLGFHGVERNHTSAAE